MFNYAEMTTAELIDLLFVDEDRVDRHHIDELIRRGEEAAAPLREILKNEDYWYEGQGGNYWILVHAIVVLSAMKDEKALSDLIEMVPHAYFSNHDDAAELLPAALAQFGEEAVGQYIEFINEHRGAHRDNQDYSYCRHVLSSALTRIALEHPATLDQVTDFICGNFEDAEEDDKVFLSFSAAHPIALNEKRGMKALQAAYRREAIDEELNGKFDDFIEFLNDPDFDAFFDLELGLFDFYDPQSINRRQREKAEKKEVNLYSGIDRISMPAGYAVSQAGSIVRSEKVGRNDPCPCGSGKKYKKCCGAAE